MGNDRAEDSLQWISVQLTKINKCILGALFFLFESCSRGLDF